MKVKSVCAMTVGFMAGIAGGMLAKEWKNSTELRKIRKKTKKLLEKIENYVSESLPMGKD